MPPRARFAVIAALLASLAAPAAQAQWVWKDNTGHTVASDRPPPASIPERNISQRPAAAARAPAPTAGASAPSPAAAGSSQPLAAEGRARVDPELEARRQRAEQEQAAQRKAEEARVAAQRADNCQRARDAIRQLDSGMRIARVNDKGEREVIDDAARAAEMQRAREVAASECR